MNTNIVAVDIGNTTVEIAFFNDTNIIAKLFVPSKPLNVFDLQQKVKEKSPFILKGVPVIISSVVPDNNEIVLALFLNVFKSNAHIIDANKYDVIAKVHSREISKVGMDIICKSVWASRYLQEDVLILDIGTATVLQYNKQDYIEKVAITIGFNTIYKALNANAALLPLLEPQKTSTLFGTETLSNIYGGTYWGYIGLLNTWIMKAEQEIVKHKIFVTGGLSKIIKDDLNFQYTYDDNIVFKGIKIIYENNKKLMNKDY
jgi:type III pantothenate kinase